MKEIPAIPKEDVLEITLLSTLEAREIPQSILESPACCWWLRTPGVHPTYAATVCYFGNVLTRGHEVTLPNYGVRPALRVSPETVRGMSVGDKASCAGRQWIYGGKDLLLLAGEPLAAMPFHRDKDAYEHMSEEEKYLRSDIRRFIRDWFDRA